MGKNNNMHQAKREKNDEFYSWCPEQFEIVSFRKGDDGKDLAVGGVWTYTRILIRKIRQTGKQND